MPKGKVVSESKVRRVRDIAESVLDEVGEGKIQKIYLIGSRASGKSIATSDWDFLVVGDGLNLIEGEKIRRAEEGNPFPGTGIDVAPGGSDIIFSSTGPHAKQSAIQVWPPKKPSADKQLRLERDLKKLKRN